MNHYIEDYYIGVLKKYAVFSGRARRAEYWYFFLFSLLIGIALGVVSAAIGDSKGTLGTLYSVAVFIPGLAVSVRRLHDIGKSGWMLLLSLIPIIGAIWIFILMLRDSNPGENKYGPNPKGVKSVQE